MAISLRNHLLNNLSLSICSLLLAFGVWRAISSSAKIHATIPATIFFYNTNNKKIIAPEQCSLTVYAKRSTVTSLIHTAAIHIDAQQYHNGKNKVLIKKEMFDIPSDVLLLNYTQELVINIEPAH